MSSNPSICATSTTPGDPYATDFTYQHVGARYYDPSTGRFLQRDADYVKQRIAGAILPHQAQPLHPPSLTLLMVNGIPTFNERLIQAMMMTRLWRMETFITLPLPFIRVWLPSEIIMYLLPILYRFQAVLLIYKR